MLCSRTSGFPAEPSECSGERAALATQLHALKFPPGRSGVLLKILQQLCLAGISAPPPHP